MKKNWLIFIVICTIAWFWMVSNQFSEQRRYEQAYKAYLVESERYAEAMAEAARVREAARAAAAAALEEVRRSTAEVSAAPDDPAPPVVQTEIRKLERLLYRATTAPRHVIDTPLYRVVVSELGARPISWEIKTSPFVTNARNGGTTDTVQMIPQVGLDSETREFPLGLVGNTARDFNDYLFTLVERTEQQGATRLVFRSDAADETDLVCTKTFLFRHDGYVVDLDVTFANGPRTIKLLGGRQGFGLGWQGGFGMPEAVGRVHGLISVVYGLNDSVRTRRIARAEDRFELEGAVDWIGQEKKYFTALLIPREERTRLVRASVDRRNDAAAYQMAGVNPPINVEALHEPREINEGEATTLRYQVYVGPKNREALQSPVLALAAGATAPVTLVFHTIPLGMTFLRPIALALLWLMRMLHSVAGSWGLAIVATTITVRLLIYPLTHWAIKAQAKTMIEQQKIRPEMEEIQKKFKSDPMKRNQAIMQLYRDHNVNPLGMLRGCVPILLQAPIFMALYVLFDQAVELRGKSFLWIGDLSGPDALFSWGVDLWIIGPSFNLLPIIMGATNFIQMRIMQMPSTDELQAQIQKQMMVMMPIMFTFFLYQLPSGLVLYWIVSNTISIGQSYLTKRIIASHMAAHEQAKLKLATS
jgi:YidC/Oxa1 family membrane protein insertase